MQAEPVLAASPTPRLEGPHRGRRVALVALLVSAALIVGCSSRPRIESSTTRSRLGADDAVIVRTSQSGTAIDRRIFGTNLPAWLLPDLVADPTFRELTTVSGTTLLRLPGGSWSNQYDWLGCEERDPDRCAWTWAMRPSDFIDVLEATGLPAMWTASINGTAQEAAAAVAFFNGRVDDPRPIGVDRNGVDWQTVGHWAQLRTDNGHPNPVGIRYWEIGNEVYGASPSAGPDCASWGWEDVWTCDGTEYAEGTASHDGYLQFHAAMVGVDGDIEVGAVGVGAKGEWGDWDDKVMSAAGPAIDFYVVHHYGSNGDVTAEQALRLPSSTWPRVTDDLRDGFADHGMDGTEIAVTEHNLVAFIDGDDERLMISATNAFYLAETIGEMAANGVAIANQWNIANGRAPNGSDYGLFEATTHERTPAYFAFALWSRFGEELVPVEAGSDLDDVILYGGRSSDGSGQLLAINPSATAVDASVAVEGPADDATVSADVVVASSLQATQITYNGSTSPSIGLTEPAQVVPRDEAGDRRFTFAPYSITLLRWTGQG